MEESVLPGEPQKKMLNATAFLLTGFTGVIFFPLTFRTNKLAIHGTDVTSYKGN